MRFSVDELGIRKLAASRAANPPIAGPRVEASQIGPVGLSTCSFGTESPQLRRGPTSQRLAEFMRREFSAFNASGVARYPRSRSENLSIGGVAPTLVLEALGPGTRPNAVAHWRNVDPKLILEDPRKDAEAAVLDCGSALNVMEFRFLRQELQGRGLGVDALRRLCPTQCFEISTVPNGPLNPLFELYGYVEYPPGFVSESNVGALVQPGDLVYIQGDPDYAKRWSGDDRKALTNQGWHLACSGRNEAGELLFVGFSEKMTRPFTYKELRALLLEEYPQAERASIPIGGILAVRAIDEEALSKALLAAQEPAQGEPLGFIGRENRTNRIENFAADTPMALAMLEGARAFVREVESSPDKSHLLLIEGVPGIGKTHLAVGIVHELEKQGKTTCFITPTAIADAFNRSASADGGLAFWRQMGSLMNADVIVLDDLNTYFGVNRQAQQLALDRAGLASKTVIVTSNRPPMRGQVTVEDHQALHSRWASEAPDRRSMVVLDGLTGESHRSEDAAGPPLGGTALEQIAAWSEEPRTGLSSSRGVIASKLETSASAAYDALRGPGRTARLMGWSEITQPYHLVSQLAADSFVIDVPRERYAHQLYDLARFLERLHNAGGKKVVIVCDGAPADFAKEFREAMAFLELADQTDTTRFIDRWRVMFGGGNPREDDEAV